MTTIGLIGAGHIGSQIARKAVQLGYQVVLSNRRGPEVLGDLVQELGDHARAASPAEAAETADLAVVTIPLKAIGSVPIEPLIGKIVIDTNNYYPQRDGQITALDEETTTTAQMLQEHLPESFVVKAFNHIPAADITTAGRPAGDPDRRALAVASDHDAALLVVSRLLDRFGFDPVPIQPLSESWRIQRDTPGYVQPLTAPQLVHALAIAKRYRDM
ncbi:NADPH-dependent F420 reductase [Acidipropionibacterium jensenii]|uniref:NADPH-dependent F420 reductase n=1 Tax=Acidipropionibacterium jensenii TaxID=1749 RepID=UPI002647276E|nr:NAD(P)-binding domain-containing protein [Acidipropionibacterium jensenii]MDN5978350.1 NAD(P)-binding domain-containing protein [Acidipropionibacterium jensenii]MDN5997486.1 NAD(P)-binding domain-containing protein [Acidipropionibacterium jensenii]MDN6427755.1 NAD(P)-binding domain-containing protein [Acidipropionibacterium jensenii]MDN6442437.1 NAD(P)-binding domain-containing protein [Acidipropionibacterium jensenii]MDN6481006.1 NAD(P)-binding domain-containing protein [Acidipropionibacte